MNLYTSKTVNLISIIITIIIFLIFSQIDFTKINLDNVFKINISEDISKEINPDQTIEELEDSNVVASEQNEAEKPTEVEEEPYEWYISIPQIDLMAPIEETVEKDVMNRSVGHFPNTSKWEGNIGLGAHNRGYKVNYFSEIKKLKKGDIIIYKFEGKTRQYSVSNIVIIKDTDWSYLEKTEDNRITLITCVENEPNYRRCIQGIEL